MRLKLALLCLSAVGLLLTGCPTEDPNLPWPYSCEDLASETPSIEPGTGETSFVEVEDGQLLSPEYGSQGGMHIWGSIRATWLHPADVSHVLTVSTDEGYVASSRSQGEFARTGGEHSERLGQPMFLELSYSLTPSLFTADPNGEEDWEARDALFAEAWDRLADMDLVFRAEVTDGCGTTATAVRTVRADTAGLTSEYGDI